MTDDIIRLAVQKHSFALLHVPKDKITEEIIELALKK